GRGGSLKITGIKNFFIHVRKAKNGPSSRRSVPFRELVVAANQRSPSCELHPGAFAFRRMPERDGGFSPLSEEWKALGAFNKGGTAGKPRPLMGRGFMISGSGRSRVDRPEATQINGGKVIPRVDGNRAAPRSAGGGGAAAGHSSPWNGGDHSRGGSGREAAPLRGDGQAPQREAGTGALGAGYPHRAYGGASQIAPVPGTGAYRPTGDRRFHRADRRSHGKIGDAAPIDGGRGESQRGDLYPAAVQDSLS